MKNYLVHEQELELFKARYTGLLDSGAGFYLKAWVCRVHDDGQTLDVVVSEEKPPIQILEKISAKATASPETPDTNPEPRIETFWGDLKRVSMKAAQGIQRQIDHDRELRSKHQAAPNAITIRVRDRSQMAGVNIGEAHYFRLAQLNGLRFPIQRSYAFVAEADAVFPVPPITFAGGLADCLRARTNRRLIKAAAVVAGVVMFFVIIPSHLPSTPEASVQRTTASPVAKSKNEILLEKREAKFGKRPEVSAWDGSYSEVKTFLQESANDPDSIKIESCTEVSIDTRKGWTVGCNFRGKNGFGATVLNANWFIIRNGVVTEMLPANAYTR